MSDPDQIDLTDPEQVAPEAVPAVEPIEPVEPAAEAASVDQPAEDVSAASPVDAETPLDEPAPEPTPDPAALGLPRDHRYHPDGHPARLPPAARPARQGR